MESPRTPKTRDCLVRRYEPGDERTINEMFSEVFQVPRTLDAWRWKYMEGPYGTGCIGLGFSPSGELISHYAGYVVQIARWNGKTFDRSLGVQIGDKMTRPDARHRGMGRSSLLALTVECFRTCLEDSGIDTQYGFNTGTARRFGVRFLGYDVAESVGYWRAETERFRGEGLGSRLARLAQGWQVIELRESIPELDTLFADAARDYPALVCRDSAYVAWRYFNCPDKDYRVFALMDRRGLLGWGVFVQDGARIKWGDALFRQRTSVNALRFFLSRVVALGGYAGATEIHAWASKEPKWWCDRLRGCGFGEEKEPNDLAMVFISTLETDAPTARPVYFTWGDSDLF